MSHNPGPGITIPANVWSKSITVPTSMLNGTGLSASPHGSQYLHITAGQNLIGSTSDLDDKWPCTSETDILKEEVKKLTAKVAALEISYQKQDECITHLYKLIEELQENRGRYQNNSGQHGYQVAGLVARDYWQTSQE